MTGSEDVAMMADAEMEAEIALEKAVEAGMETVAILTKDVEIGEKEEIDRIAGRIRNPDVETENTEVEKKEKKEDKKICQCLFSMIP